MNDVVWVDTAPDQLAAIYVATATGERNDPVAAVEAIDRTLGGNGPLEGQSRGGTSRVYFHDLLVITFAAEPNGPVTITGVRANKRLRK